MLLLNYMLALVALLMVAVPIYGKKPHCAKCDHEGESKCGFVGIGEKGTRVCRKGCWTVNNLVCQTNEVCRERPIVHCTTKAEACAGCSEFFNHCKNDYWDICDQQCQVKCAQKTCDLDGGRCDTDCVMDICKK
ncbi:hypothetical protein T440DRAFT_391901 [Plenodomus tracheiphilus IPT5]|uniref:Uncharacterized protein n=1 Tax=Plenodomus tracheiphilus IPT5 TaxID=1408161 RepID=A0A6A7BEU2_9PLEO|nr:hypothetical protein T440DRAFT_391901 [Plenodomus tracheiphilus IPT5]